jgi:putative SOS response-associated peptidase YedK
MPVIRDPDTYDSWLDTGMHDMRAASDMLKPYDAPLMRSYRVSSRVNQRGVARALKQTKATVPKIALPPASADPEDFPHKQEHRTS